MDTENSIFNIIMRRTITKLRQLTMFQTTPRGDTPTGYNIPRFFDVTVTSVEQSASKTSCFYSSSDHNESNDEDLPYYNVYRSETTPNNFWRKSNKYSEYQTRSVRKQICSRRMSVSSKRMSASSKLLHQRSNKKPSNTDTVVIELGDEDIEAYMGITTKSNGSDNWSNGSFDEYYSETHKSIKSTSSNTIKIMIGDDTMDSSSCSSSSSDEYYCKTCQQYSTQEHCASYRNRQYHRDNMGSTDHQCTTNKPALVAPAHVYQPPPCGTPEVPHVEKGDKMIQFTENATQVIANPIQLSEIQDKESSVVFRESTDASMQSNGGDGVSSRVKYHKKLRHSACFISESSQSELIFESYSESTVRSTDNEIWEPLSSSEQLSRDIKKVIRNNPQFLIKVKRKRANSCVSMLPSSHDEDTNQTQSETSLKLRNKPVRNSCSSPLITERAAPSVCRPVGPTVVSWCSHSPNKKHQSAQCEPDGNEIYSSESKCNNKNVSNEEVVLNYDTDESVLIRENIEKSPDVQTLDEQKLESETEIINEITVKPQTSIVRENLEIYERISAVLAMNHSSKVMSTLEKKEPKETNYVAEKSDKLTERASDVWNHEKEEPENKKDMGKKSDKISDFDLLNTPSTSTGIDRNNTENITNQIRTHLEKLFEGATEVRTLEKLYTIQEEKMARRLKLPNQTIIKGKVSILQHLSTLTEYSSSSTNSAKPRDRVVKVNSYDENNARTSDTRDRILRTGDYKENETKLRKQALASQDRIRITGDFKESQTADYKESQIADTENQTKLRKQAKRYMANQTSKLRQSKVVCFGVRRVRNVRNNMMKSIDSIRNFVSRGQSKDCLVIEDIPMSAIQKALGFQTMSDTILYPDIRIDEGRHHIQINMNEKIVNLKIKTNIKFKLNTKIKLKKVKVNQNICFRKYQLIDHNQILDSLIWFRLNDMLCELFSVRKIINKAMEENEKRALAVGLDKNANDMRFPQLIRIENYFHDINVDQFYSNFEGQFSNAISLKSNLVKVKYCNINLEFNIEPIHVNNINIDATVFNLVRRKQENTKTNEPSVNLISFSDEKVISHIAEIKESLRSKLPKIMSRWNKVSTTSTITPNERSTDGKSMTIIDFCQNQSKISNIEVLISEINMDTPSIAEEVTGKYDTQEKNTAIDNESINLITFSDMKIKSEIKVTSEENKEEKSEIKITNETNNDDSDVSIGPSEELSNTTLLMRSSTASIETNGKSVIAIGDNDDSSESRDNIYDDNDMIDYVMEKEDRESYDERYKHTLETLSEKTEHTNSFTSSDPGTIDKLINIQLKTKLSQLRRTLSHCLKSYIQTFQDEFNLVGSLKTASNKIIQDIKIQLPSDCFLFCIKEQELKIETRIFIQTGDHCYVSRHYLESRVISLDSMSKSTIGHAYHHVNNLPNTIIYNASIAEEESKIYTIIREENKEEHITKDENTVSTETVKTKQAEENISNSGLSGSYKTCEENEESLIPNGNGQALSTKDSTLIPNGNEIEISTKDNNYTITNQVFEIVAIEENEDSITTEDTEQRLTETESETETDVHNEDSLRKQCVPLETNINKVNVFIVETRSKDLSHLGTTPTSCEIKKTKRRHLRRMSSHCERDREFALRRRLIINKIRKTKTANRSNNLSQE